MTKSELKVVHNVLDLALKAFQSPAKVISLDDDLDAALRTGECRIGLQPSAAVVAFTAALRTLKSDPVTLEHDASSLTAGGPMVGPA